MNNAPSLESALTLYAQALNGLKSAKGKRSPDQALEVLLSRDAVQAVLEKESSASTSNLIKLKALDRDLKEQCRIITQTIDLDDWRTLTQASEKNWWWYLEPPALFPWLERPHPWLEGLDWLWKLLTVLTLTISATFILNTLRRVLEGGLDGVGTFAIVIQSVLALAGGSALTQQGQAFLESVLTRWRIPKHYWQEFGVILSVLFLAAVIAIHNLYLPHLARQLVKQGEVDYQANRLDSALSAYQQAIALRPDNAEAHYRLGLLYEDLQQLDKAIAEYQLVVQRDITAQPNLEEQLLLLRAHNNLGRLYLLKGNPAAAWVPLETGERFATVEAIQSKVELQYEKYKLLKNLGWVRLQQKYYIDAEDWLNQAIKMQAEAQLEALLEQDGGKAAAYCLRAQVYDAQKLKEKAQTNWETCIQYAKRTDIDEAQWLGMANERLHTMEQQP